MTPYDPYLIGDDAVTLIIKILEERVRHNYVTEEAVLLESLKWDRKRRVWMENMLFNDSDDYVIKSDINPDTSYH